MLRIVGAETMQQVDQQATEIYGCPGIELMEQAGQSLANRARKLISRERETTVVVLVGSGKNGGDGLVCARALHESGIGVVVLMVEHKHVAIETRENLTQAQSLGIPVAFTKERCPEDWHVLIHEADLIVDALFGIGISGDPREPYTTIIHLINESPAMVLAADLPSGLNADTGQPANPTVQADYTLTFGLPKKGLFYPCAAKAVGQLSVDTIGFPEKLITGTVETEYYVDATVAARFLPKRAVDAHKKNTGKVVVIGGSGDYHGAVLLAARGALRAGSGHVTQAYPKQLNMLIREHALETLCVPLACNRRCSISRRALGAMMELSEDKDAVVVGPGMGWEPTTQRLIQSYIDQIHIPKAVIVDADALHAVAEKGSLHKKGSHCRIVLTPHEGEAAILLNTTSIEIHNDRLTASREIATRYNSVVVLKGQHTIVTSPEDPFYIIGSGTQALATAGTGDVLCGIIAALVSQKMPVVNAAILGAFLHGMAGVLASPDPMGLGARAGEIADLVPQAIADLRFYPKVYVKTKKSK